MKVTQERLAGSRVALTVEIEPERVTAETDRTYQRLGRRVAVPGFRPGKAPRHILRNYVGEQRVRQEMLDQLVPDAYQSALKEAGVEPLADPDVELVATEPNAAWTFRATVPVAPTVQLGDYRSVRVARVPVETTDKDVDEAVEQLRQSHSTWEDDPERAIEEGDRVTADVRVEIDGEVVQDTPDMTLVVGSGLLPREVEEGLPGTRVGEERVVLTTVPEESPWPNQAGKEAVYAITVKSVQRRVLPEADDEFAEKTGLADSMPALREVLRQRLQEGAESREQDRQRTAVVDGVIVGSTLDFPAVLVERHLDRSLNNLFNSLARQGFNPEQYFRLTGTSIEDTRDRWRPDSERTVKEELVLDEVAKQEQVEPTDEQLSAEFERLNAGVPPAQRLDASDERLQRAMRAILARRMALERLVELTVVDPAPGGAPIEGTATESAEGAPEPGSTAPAAREEATITTEATEREDQ